MPFDAKSYGVAAFASVGVGSGRIVHSSFDAQESVFTGANAIGHGLISDVVDGVYAARRTSVYPQLCWTPMSGETMTAAPEVTATDVTTFAASNVTAGRCDQRTSHTPRSPVVGQHNSDRRRTRPALRKLGRSGT
jgi:hypothetical protein